jgi:predicted ATPase/class 3 adenylate cyclase
VRDDLPRGTVTFLFTDVEGSTRLLGELGAEDYAAALAEHRRLIRDACSRHAGVEVDTQGDAFFFAFPTAHGALAAARAATDALATGRVQVRIGVHTGTPLVTDEGYVGDDVHLAARVGAAGHGGQVLVSASAAAHIEPSGSEPRALPLVELGDHRLKDIAEPVAIFQLGNGSFPPLKTISNTNLPRPASSFVGRERELSEVLARIERGARLVTLTGTGGSGKTRLAIEAAATLVPEYKAGVFWVGLAALRDPALVSETIAQTLGAKDGLAEHVGERELLLLLDNLEQVIEAAPELSALLRACPNLSLLVTSRELLRVQGEVEYPVQPLAESEAVALFCERSRLERSEDVAELCARLDSLPLAVELAASRTKALSPAQILERLSQRLDLLRGGRDADPRQQTLRATIEWSYDLLKEDEQRLFRALSVFAGGCTLDAADEVADADLDTLQSLVEKSLVHFSNERYLMLETIREYAAECLGSAEAEAVSSRHTKYFLRLAEEASVHVRYDSSEWTDRLEVEHDNLRAALDRLEADGETQLVLGLVGAIWRFWFRRGHLAEGRRRIESALAADERPTAARARALHGATVLTFNLGDTAAARPWAEEALSLHRELGDAWGIALSLMILGGQATEEGDPATAVPLFEESVRRFRDLGDERYGLMAASNLAWAYEELGDRERARAQHEEVLRGARALNVEEQQAHSLLELAMLSLGERRVADAVSPLRESLVLWHQRGNTLWVATNLIHVAAALSLRGEPREATAVLSAGEAIRARIGNRSAWLDERREEALATLRSELDERGFEEAWAQGNTMKIDEAVAYALASLD